MHGPQWSDDPDTPALLDNLSAVAESVVLDALGGDLVTPDSVKRWHLEMYAGIQIPSEVYLGRFRGDSGHPWLVEAENGVQGGRRGLRSYLVFGAVEQLFARTHTDIEILAADESISVERDYEAIRIAAYLHGEWIRIHPFVNGNGRTARMLVLWVLARFGIPPLLQLHPRPADPYGSTSDSSMAGDDEPFEIYLRDLYAAEARKEHELTDDGSGSESGDARADPVS
jgi:hypothetical protein